MAEKLTIFIPMAGWGTRMRPHTWSKPKPLVSVAGKTSLEHLLDMFKSVPDVAQAEFVFILGPYLGELQIPPFIKEHYPELKAHFVVQHEMKGQSHALWLAREYLHGPMIVCFSDTLMETDFAFLRDEKADGVAWVMPVEDPRRFGVAETGPDGWVTRFIEKPHSLDNNLVVVGCYYLREAGELLAAIEDQMHRGMMFKGEYFLTDTISLMIRRGARIRTEKISTWLDTGTIEATLDTNCILLDRGADNTAEVSVPPTVRIVPPVFVHPSAQLSESVIGPHVSIGPECSIRQAVISESIIEAGTRIERAALTRSLIGRNCVVEGQPNREEAARLNIGDNSTVIAG
ncbi:MAG: sugar phosphate nucleotidyltransferase [Bacteroidota bacterium]